MPIRARSHVLETDSRRAFAAILPSEWIIRPQPSDYDLDDQVEVFEAKGQTTGLIFFVQLKATDNLDLDAALRLRFSVDTLNYYRSLDVPVMIVRFHSKTRKFYWRWFHEFRERPKVGQKTLTLKLPSTGEWNNQASEQVNASLEMRPFFPFES